MSEVDPFDTAGLRRSVLRAWESSPTRFREDANAEEDLRLGGYRDRLLVELAQNAADAVGTGGVLAIELVDDELRVANTGAPLSAEGVTGLASLRASAKRSEASVGRFGVGFAAVLGVSDRPRVLSSSGGVAFSAERTRAEAAALPGVADELSARDDQVPVLRLPWPTGEAPPEGFTTQVRLPLRSDVDGAALLDDAAAQAGDLLLALSALTEIRVGERRWRRAELPDGRVRVDGPEGSRTWVVQRASGELPERVLTGLGAESRRRTRWQVCWAVPVDDAGAPLPLDGEVLHAPTPTEERLSVPARLLAGVPMEPDRRRVAASPATETVLLHAAECYPDLVRQFSPAERTALVPLADFPLSDVDDKLRQAVLDRLRVTDWLPAARGGEVAPSRARVLAVESADLAAVLDEVLPDLLATELAEPQRWPALSTLGVRRCEVADVVEAVTGLRRPASWWHQLYAALAPVAESSPRVREELAALPVPLADGRTVTGPREVLISDDPDTGDPVHLLSTMDISGLRIVAPEAAHPLLQRLGAHSAGPAELLDAAPLAEAVRASVAEARAGVAVLPLARAVLDLVAEVGARDWLGALALPDADGEFRRADELLLPDAALRDVLDPDAVGEDGPLSVLDPEFAEERSREVFVSVGVVDGFAVRVEHDPVEPPHWLADAHEWWQERERATPELWPPEAVHGIRDLDLVAEDRWPEAIRLLLAEPDTARLLRDPTAHPAWWLARYAVLAGRAPRDWSLPESVELAGLYDPVPDVGLTLDQLRAAGVREHLRIADAEDAVEVLARLGERERSIRPGTALRAHKVLADAVACGAVDPASVDPPSAVRSISGAVVGVDRAVVLDEPWMLGVLAPPLVVSGGSAEDFDAEALAELLDLPLSSEESDQPISGDGTWRAWHEVARVPAACELLGSAVPDDAVRIYPELRVGDQRVHWWVDDAGVHAEATPDGTGRALAWVAGCWSQRFALIALLADPQATTVLR